MTGNTKKVVNQPLYYYDVNSMYPENMKGLMPVKMKSIKTYKIEITNI